AAGFEKQVVIKRILPQLAGDERFVRRLLEEGKLQVQLQHSGIVQVLDLGESDGVPYLVMEYVDGRDLRDLFCLGQTCGIAPSPEVVVSILVHLLEALDYAHGATDSSGEPLGIIHRDVSPANVIINSRGEVKLADFGIARVADQHGLSMPGAVQGKFAYMSPEQASGQEIDPRSDQFSAGVMAWELLTGSRPFDGDTDMATLERIRTSEPGSLGDAWPQGAFEVVTVVDRLMARAPDERFSRASDASDELRAWLVGEGSLGDSRETAAWVQQVEDQRTADDRPSPVVSIEDALRLGLGSDSQTGQRPPTATASVHGVPVTVPGPVSHADGRSGGDSITAPPMTPPPRRRWHLISLLVGLNVLLLGSVAFLLLRQPEPVPAIPASEVARPSGVDSPVKTESETPPAPPPVVVQEAIPEAEDEPSARVQEIVPEPAPAAAAPSDDGLPTGRVRFRFFPASSKVLIDGSAVRTQRPGSNVVDLSLPARRHHVTIIGPLGRKRRIPFEVKPGELTNLATISLESGQGASEAD
ncbi:MAG: serine/threonine-protein kinase, partial [Myxococcota bacterium]|nr:serine/threonine-protein kinase [Myxococcota bacterium]